MVHDDFTFGFGGLFEQIHSTNHVHSFDQPVKAPASNSRGSSMVTIRDPFHSHSNNDCSIFPPTDHENLQIQEQHKHQNPSSKSSPLSFSPPDLITPSNSKEVIGEWLDFGFQVLRRKICSLFSNNGAVRGLFGSFGSAAGIALLLLWWWLCRRSRQRRTQKENVEYLKLIIKHKDEKITQLLHQIAQMNEVLVARHKLLTSRPPN